MRKELFETLCKDFPLVFKNYTNNTFPGDGWESLIREICKEMERIRKLTGIQFFATRVKEKWGMLAFYFDVEDRLLKISKKEIQEWKNKMFNFINDKSIVSGVVCEKCGNIGYIDDSAHWKQCLCDKCRAKKKNEI